MYSDSHAHMVDYTPEQVKSIVELMQKNEVDLVLGVGVSMESSEGTIKLAEMYGEIKAGIGIHPWFAAKLDDDTKKQFEKLAGSRFVCAIGEIGLDYAPPGGGPPPEQSTGGTPAGMPAMPFPENMPPLPKTPPTPETQKELLRFELDIARKYNLPVNVHCLGGAHQDMMQILKNAVKNGLTGMAHGFEGDQKMLEDWLGLGFYIVFGTKLVLREPASNLEQIVRATPLDKMLVETDANPMHSPDGPLGVIPVCRKIAEIRGITTGEIGQATTDNLKQVLKL